MTSIRSYLPVAAALLILTADSVSAQTTHVVTLQGATFSPQDITVAEGDTVRWDWVSGIHNVVSGPGGAADGFFSSGSPTSPPMSFSVVFNHVFLDANAVAGNRYDYFCEVHLGLGMIGSVTVDVKASGFTRNAGTNPNSLTLLNPPQFGTSLSMVLDLSSTGHTLAGIVAFQSELTFTLPGGQTLLVNPADPGGELLSQSIQAGPVTNWMIPVPNDPSLNGFWYAVQGVHIGGVQPFALSNALDLTIGS